MWKTNKRDHWKMQQLQKNRKQLYHFSPHLHQQQWNGYCFATPTVHWCNEEQMHNTPSNPPIRHYYLRQRNKINYNKTQRSKLSFLPSKSVPISYCLYLLSFLLLYLIRIAGMLHNIAIFVRKNLHWKCLELRTYLIKFIRRNIAILSQIVNIIPQIRSHQLAV